MLRLILAIAVMALFGAALAVGAEDATQKLYETKCASCHGKDGKGNPKLAKTLKVEPAKLDLTGPGTAKAKDADLIKITADGKGKMPKYAGKLKPAEIEALVKYIRALKK